MNRRLIVIADRHWQPAFSPAVPADETLGEAALKDTLAKAGAFEAGKPGSPGLVLLYHGERIWYERRTSSFWLLLPQMGNTVTQWLDNALLSLCPDASDQTIFLGARTPHLSVHLLEQAFDGLGRFAAVIGPSEGGSPYLLGVRGRWPTGALSRVRWDQPQAADDIRLAFRRARLAHAVLPRQHTLHTTADLERLAKLLPEHPERDLAHLRRLLCRQE